MPLKECLLKTIA